jgi:K319-like protein/HYR domain-containing protein
MRSTGLGLILILSVTMSAATAKAADFTMPVAGHLSVVLDGSGAQFHNTISIVQPDDATYGSAGLTKVKIKTIGVRALDGCSIEDSQITGAPSPVLLSERTNDFGTSPEVYTQHGCRVEIVPFTYDPSVPGSDVFPAGAKIRFAMCAQAGLQTLHGEPANTNCDFIWTSEPSKSRALDVTGAMGTVDAYVSSADGLDHVRTCPPSDGSTDTSCPAGQQTKTGSSKRFTLFWEDIPQYCILGLCTTASDGTPWSDQDYDDIVVDVRVDGDTDGDGLWDDWETPVASGGGIVDPVFGTVFDLAALGATVGTKDIFLHLDYMDCATGPADSSGACASSHSHAPDSTAISKLTAAFAAKGITLHVETAAVAHHKYTSLTGKCNSNQAIDASSYDFDLIKKPWSSANPGKHVAYHYGVIGHEILQGTTASGATGCAETPGNDFLVTLAALSTGPVGNVMDQAGTIMHELGHNLDLHHGGGPNCSPLPSCVLQIDSLAHKPNYLSVMDYLYQRTGIPCASGCGTAGAENGRIDYSNSVLPALDELTLNENDGVGHPVTTDNLIYYCPAGGDTPLSCPGADPAAIGSQVVWPGVAASGNIDWTCNTVFETNVCSTSIDDTVTRDKLSSYNDWANLQFDFQVTTDFEDGVHASPTQEATVAQLTPPIPSTGGPYMCECGTSVLLDDSGSSDPNGTIASYGWSFVTPEVIDHSGTAPKATSYPCPSLGTNTIWLTVKDNDNLSVIDTTTVNTTDTKGPVLTMPSSVIATADSNCGATVTYTASAKDACSGPAPISCSPASGTRFNGGTTTVNCTATDANGHTTTGSFKVYVRYAFGSFLQPINSDGSSIFRLGTTVPTKFTLTGASALCQNAIAHLEVAKITGGILGSFSEQDQNVPPSSGDLFRYTGGQYEFNEPTSDLSTGTWVWRVNFDDGDNSHTVNISLR